MLCQNSYEQDYIDDCRAKVDAQVAAYRAMADASSASPALEAFEPVFFNDLVLVLDSFFTHRGRGQEGKDGNPLNEVRMLGAALTGGQAVLGPDKTIKYDPATSVLGYEFGDEIRLREADFTRLAKAYFAEIETRFS